MRALLLAALFAALFSAQAASQEQTSCLDRPDMVRFLNVEMKQTRVSFGLSSNGYLIEVYESIDGDRWTLILTSPAMVSCLLDSGNGWRTSRLGLGYRS